jgi:methionyl-tRNA synthetase
MPETKDNDFTWKDFQARNNNELVAILGNFINRALMLALKYSGGKVPEANELTDYDHATLAQIPSIKENIESCLENFRFRDALREMMNLARLGNKYLADTEPWKIIKTDPGRVGTILNTALQISANLALMSEPFLPFTAKKIRQFLNFSIYGWNEAGKKSLLEAGQRINDPDLLFEIIEDTTIEDQIRKLFDTKKENNKSRVSQQKPDITFDDFTKLDIRTGTITEAEKVPKTTKLLKLKIDTGIDVRTVVSGIAEHYSAEEVIGKQVTILLNLETRKIKNIDSHGMILMAEDNDGNLVFVLPEKKTVNGSVVK